MKENVDANSGSGRKRPDEPQEPLPNGTRPATGQALMRPISNDAAPQAKLTAWSVMDVLARRWYWLVLGGAVFAAGFYLLGDYLVKPKFTATAQLLRYDTPVSESLKPAQISSETFSGLIRSPELLRAVGEQEIPPIPGDKLAKCIKIDPQPDSDLVKVLLATRDPKLSVRLLNNYLTNVVTFTTKIQKEQVSKVANEYLRSQVQQMDSDIKEIENRLRGVPDAGSISNKMSEVGGHLNSLSNQLASPRLPSAEVVRLNERISTAMGELHGLLEKYTEEHPYVRAKQAILNDLNAQKERAFTNAAAVPANLAFTPMRPTGLQGLDPEIDIIHIKMRSLEDARQQLVNRQREAAAYVDNPPGIVRIFAIADPTTVQTNMRLLKIIIMAIFGCVLGMGASLGLVVVTELTDKRLKTSEDVRRVTKLPVLTVLGDLKKMQPEERQQWAFRTWTMLQGRLSPTPNHGLVCGITSSTQGEGRSTWINLLAEAASSSGFRVLTISTRPSPIRMEGEEAPPDEISEKFLEQGMKAKGLLDNGEFSEQLESSPNGALTANVLASPARVTEQLTGPNSQPMVHIPLPGWVWNLERRKQWREALNQWRKIDNLVILVELPPANKCESVLLGSNLPNLLWLSECGSADAAQTRAQLETLRHARCNLVGAVVNRDANGTLKRLFPRWVECVPLILAFSLFSVRGQETNALDLKAQTRPVAAQTSDSPGITRAFSIVSPAQRAAWQQRLTLGPGDVLDLGLYGAPETVIRDVAIPPDGHLSYLEATNVLVSGLTVDEMRERLEQELGKYRRAPRTIITPVAFRSKKYYMLGKVMLKGVYTLDRPITVLEAIARAHGLENGLVDRNVVDLADFQRSFLMRGGKRIPLNFEKLFQEGDLSQNLPIEPGDYLYFPSTTVHEVYVVGEVRLPGPVTYHKDMTIIGAISARAGYTDRAYKARVLVVRGSLNNPERFAVDTHAILDGNAQDFKLQPKDIIFVNSRPFIKVEELVDMAATAFIQSLITSWVGVDVVKPIQ